MSTTATISVPAPADFHVHLRQGDLSQLVTPHVREGGFRLAYVMVNLVCQKHPAVELRCLTSQISPRLLPPRIKH
jgi:dihydroorotase